MIDAHMISGAPPRLAEWLRTQRSLEDAWNACDRADWLLWIAQRRPLDDGQRHALVGATALAIRMSDRPKVSDRKLRLALAWARFDLSDDDPTGYRATLWSLVVGGLIGAVVKLGLYLRPEIAGGAFRGIRREMVSLPVFLVASFVLRVIGRPVSRRRWTDAVRGYSFERGETELFPLIVGAVERSEPAQREAQAQAFRERFASQRASPTSA